MIATRESLKELVDVTGFEPATPCLQSIFECIRKSRFFRQLIHTSIIKRSPHMCVDVRKCGRLYVGSLQNSLQFFYSETGTQL